MTIHLVEPPNQSLDAALRALRDDEREWSASPDVEARLLRVVQARAAERRRARLLTWAAAAALVAGIAAPLWRLARPGHDALATSTSASTPDATTPFFALVDGSLPESAGQIVRLELPRSALARFGLETPGREPATNTVLADVLVSEDGLARAVRFVRTIPSR